MIVAQCGQIDRQQVDADIEHQPGHSGLTNFARRKFEYPAQRDHQRRAGERVAIKEFIVLLAAHQPVEGMWVALDRGENVLDHRLDHLGLDRLAQPHLKEDLGHHLAPAIGDPGGMAKLARGALRRG